MKEKIGKKKKKRKKKKKEEGNYNRRRQRKNRNFVVRNETHFHFCPLAFIHSRITIFLVARAYSTLEGISPGVFHHEFSNQEIRGYIIQRNSPLSLERFASLRGAGLCFFSYELHLEQVLRKIKWVIFWLLKIEWPFPREKKNSIHKFVLKKEINKNKKE